MREYTDKQRIARAFLRESSKSIEHYRRVQEGYIRTALSYRLPAAEIAEITGRTVEDVERITGRKGGELIDDNH